jgi:hypothetical protein
MSNGEEVAPRPYDITGGDDPNEPNGDDDQHPLFAAVIVLIIVVLLCIFQPDLSKHMWDVDYNIGQQQETIK